MIRETMERLRVDHDYDHTGWKFRRDGGHCESCEKYLPLYLFVSRLHHLSYVDAPSDWTSINVVQGVKCMLVTGVAETVFENGRIQILGALLFV
jgi:hypothetical protein